MKLLSQDLVSHEYRTQLQRDLAKASICRFLVAYVSAEGLKAIGRHLLTRALRSERSFGVSSLTCSCGFDPLLHLQSELPDVRLKYFLDPLVKDDREPSEISLFHSKLVYLYLDREAKSVVYIGSHNWTRRAIGPQGPRNAEASLRFELDFASEHLEGIGTSVASEVNRHLLDAWGSPLCFPATQTNQPTFREWFEKGCRRSPDSALQKTTILLAVRRAAATPADWLQLTGKGVYLQVLDESDGKLVWDSNNKLTVLVWNSESDLAGAAQPVILQCRITTSKAGADSQFRGTNQSVAPVAGFQAVIWDDVELNTNSSSHDDRRPPVRLWSGREAQVYDFEFPTEYTDSSQLDGLVQPKYQFHLEIERVVIPADAAPQHNRPDYVWKAESFSVAESKESAKIQESPGYSVEPKREDEILEFMRTVLLIDPHQAKVRPYSNADKSKVGKRVSDHPLHDTFLGPKWKEQKQRDEYYKSSEPGSLVAELDSKNTARQDQFVFDEESNHLIPRLQRVFTAPMEKLSKLWRETALGLLR